MIESTPKIEVSPWQTYQLFRYPTVPPMQYGNLFLRHMVTIARWLFLTFIFVVEISTHFSLTSEWQMVVQCCCAHLMTKTLSFLISVPPVCVVYVSLKILVQWNDNQPSNAAVLRPFWFRSVDCRIGDSRFTRGLLETILFHFRRQKCSCEVFRLLWWHL